MMINHRTAAAGLGRKGAEELRRTSLRAASFADYDRIARVEAANGLRPRSREQWEHLWRNNPAYRAAPGWPIGWVLEDAGGSVVGSLGNLPSLYEFRGQTYVAATGRGWAVNPHHRSFSILLLAEYMRQRQADLALMTTPSPTAGAVCTRFGFQPVPVGRWDRAALWVTNAAGLARSFLSSKVPAAVAGFLGPLVAAPLGVAGAVRFRASRRSRARYDLDWPAQFDDRFDAFWQALRAARPDVLLAVRSRETLDWHFRLALAGQRLWILAAHQGARMAAYAIFERRDCRSTGSSRVLLIDFQSLVEDADLCAAMIAHALDRCIRERVDVLENAGGWIEQRALLNRPAPFHRKLGTWCYLYCAHRPELRQLLENAACWHPTYFDGDASV
jgi:hypothetical protein